MHLVYVLILSLATYGVRCLSTSSLDKPGGDEVPSKLTESGRKFLEQAMKGIDLEKHRSRLLKLGEKVKPLTTEENNKFMKLKKEINLMATKTHKNNTNSIIDINNREGLTEYLFQGDIMLTPEQLDSLERRLEEGSTRDKRQAVIGRQWTDGKVYYTLARGLWDKTVKGFMAAIKYIESRTCLTFINGKGPISTIQVVNGGGCSSYVGMINPTYQTMSLGEGCEQLGVAVHETIHALGFHHEQSRPDRDDYIFVDRKFLTDGNLVKCESKECTTFTPYEYGSVMHYRADSGVNISGTFSMIPKERIYIHTMGGYIPSFYDIDKVNQYYGCYDKCSGGNRCQNGGVPNPRSCSTCNCPSGYSGALCTERPTGCGGTLEATAEWKTQEAATTNTISIPGDVFKMCNYWIKAPAGKRIQVRLASIDEWACHYGCPFNGIEFKTRQDQKITNPRFCCKEHEGIIFDSELNPTPVISFNTQYNIKMTFAYRFVDGGIPRTTMRPGPITTIPVTQAPTTAGCKNTAEDSYCNSVASYYCKDARQFDAMKLHCAKTCNLCGVAKKPCRDFQRSCQQFKAAGFCTKLDKFEAEFHCAKTCGFCERPA